MGLDYVHRLLDDYDERSLKLHCAVLDVRPADGSDCDFLGLDLLGELTSAKVLRRQVEGNHWTLLAGTGRAEKIAQLILDIVLST